MNIWQIIEAGLTAKGYDGLYNDAVDEPCGCIKSDLSPFGCDGLGCCAPGYNDKTTARKQGADFWITPVQPNDQAQPPKVGLRALLGAGKDNKNGKNMNCLICTLPIQEWEEHEPSNGNPCHQECFEHERCRSCRWDGMNCGICNRCVDWDKWQEQDTPNAANEPRSDSK